MLVGRAGFLVRRIRGRNEQHLIEREGIRRLARHHQMRAMDGVEGPAENGSSHARVTRMCRSSSASFSISIPMRKQYILSGSAAPAGRFIISFSVVTSASRARVSGLAADFFQIGRACSDDDRGNTKRGAAWIPSVSSVRQNVRGWPSPQKAPPACRDLASRRRLRARKIGASRIVSPDQLLDSQVATLGAGNDDGRGPGQRGQRLAQPAQREHSAAQRVQRIDQHDIRDRAASENAGIRRRAGRRPASARAPCGGRLRSDRRRSPHAPAACRMNICASSPVCSTGARSAARNDHVQARLAAVSPRQDRRVPSRLGQLLRQMRHERRLPRPAHGQRANADHRCTRACVERSHETCSARCPPSRSRPAVRA